MAYALKHGQSVRKNLKRIACKQLDKAAAALASPGSRDDAVHDARVAFKKLRALLRLMRPAIGKALYREENVTFRDAARPLTEVRDARVLIDTLDKLAEHFRADLTDGAFADSRKALQRNHRAVCKRVLDEQQAPAVVTDTIRQARERVGAWADVPDHWLALGAGFERTYRQARAAHQAAVAEPTVERLHEWRKQAKYLRYQLELFSPIWPERLTELANEAKHLTDLLGDDHDLAVLRQFVLDRGVEAERETLLALIEQRHGELLPEALRLGARFFLEKPRRLVRRLKGYWQRWRCEATPVD